MHSSYQVQSYNILSNVKKIDVYFFLFTME